MEANQEFLGETNKDGRADQNQKTKNRTFVGGFGAFSHQEPPCKRARTASLEAIEPDARIQARRFPNRALEIHKGTSPAKTLFKK
eukprot:5964672-Amphidinium_carterae.1